jgi:hypothetical protein
VAGERQTTEGFERVSGPMQAAPFFHLFWANKIGALARVGLNVKIQIIIVVNFNKMHYG